MAFLRSGTRVPASAEEEEAPCADMRLSAERCIERGWGVEGGCKHDHLRQLFIERKCVADFRRSI